MENQTTTEVLAKLDLEEAHEQPSTINGVVLGNLVNISEEGWPIVDFDQNLANQPIMAASTKAISSSDIGCAVALQFVEGNPAFPVIMGILWDPNNNKGPSNIEISADNERLEISAQKEIVLRCGKSSITLTKSGKVIIRGKHLLSRSSGVNRIKGGSVQIN